MSTKQTKSGNGRIVVMSPTFELIDPERVKRIVNEDDFAQKRTESGVNYIISS